MCRLEVQASAFLVVVGLGAVCVAQAFALGAVAAVASITVMGYGLLSYWVSPWPRDGRRQFDDCGR